MLRFVFAPNDVLPKRTPDTYPDVLKYTGLFKIELDKHIYFLEPDFPIYEFLMFCTQWERSANRGDMNYISVETGENPLISFQYCQGGWKLVSPWEEVECKNVFTLDELISAIRSLKII